MPENLKLVATQPRTLDIQASAAGYFATSQISGTLD